MSKVNLKKVGVNNPILGDVQRIDENFTDVEVAINDLEDNKASQSYVDDKIGNIDFDNLAPKDSVYDKATSDNRFAPKQHTHEISDVNGLSDELESSGLTLVNLIENGDFSDGLNGWWKGGNIRNYDTNNGLTFVGRGFGTTALHSRINSNVSYKVGDYVYRVIVAKRLNNVDTNQLELSNNWSNSNKFVLSTEFKTFSDKQQYNTTPSNDTGVSISTVKDLEANVISALALNLTSTFGAGNEPTKQEMDLLIESLGVEYFEEITVTKLQVINWLLKLIRQNALATTALGGTIL